MAETPEWQTVPRVFDEAVEAAPDAVAQRYKRGGRWQETSFRELRERCQRVARFLLDLGVAPGDRVALVCHTRPEWAQVDLGILRAGAVNVPIYPSQTAEQVLYILRDSGARVVVCEDAGQLEKVRAVRDRAEALEHVVVVDPPDAGAGEGVRALPEILEAFAAEGPHDAEIARRVAAQDAEELASIVYTSGTTGNPKGVMLLHRCFAHNIAACGKLVEMTDADEHLSFLPLSHVLERTVGYYVPLAYRATINYAESQEKLVENLQEIRPTFMTSVPRLYEKIRTRILDGADKAGGIKKRLVRWAVGVGRRRARAIQGGAALGVWDSLLLRIADALVFGKIRAVMGGRLRYFLCGGAPLSPEIGEFFLGADIHILEGYGLTETAPILCANTPDRIRLGTVGRPVDGVEIRIAEEDGEILARGPNVMAGYFGNEEATREAIDDDGWFHTGDIGELTEEGCLRITDRKKNLLVLANGKNVAPAPIENLLLGSSLVNQAVVLGDDERFVSALVVPHFDVLRARAEEVLGVSPGSDAELVADPRVVELVMAEVERVTEDLARYERPKRIALLPAELSQEAGELTPTLKVKRKVVIARYEDAIRDIYDAPPPAGKEGARGG